MLYGKVLLSLVLTGLYYLQIESVPKFSQKPSDPTKAVEGENATMKWVYDLDGAAFLISKWYYVVNNVRNELAKQVLSNDPEVSDARFKIAEKATFIIINVSRSDQGRYECEVTAQSGPSLVPSSVMLNVLYPPENISLHTSTNISATLRNSTVDFWCTAVGNPAPQYKLSYNGTDLAENSSGMFQIRVTESELYICEANNSVGIGNASVYINVVDPATADVLSSPDHVVEGHDVTLQCKVTGSPPLSIKWTKVNDSNVLSNSSKLTLYNVMRPGTPGEVLQYQCTAKNAYGDPASDVATIQVYFPAKVVKAAALSLIVEGKDVVLVCTAEGNPTPYVTWFFPNGTRLKNGTTSVNFTLPSVSRDDNITYQCKATNMLGNDSVPFNLNVLYKPKILSVMPNDTEVHEHESVHFVADVEGNPEPYVAWISPNGSVLSNKTVEFNYNKTDITRGEQGRYQCRVTNIVGIDQRNFTVTILYPAQVVKPEGNISITPVERSDVDLVCSAEGNPTPHVTWFYPNGTQLRNGTTSVNFTLPSVSRDDNETYQCKATNKFGSDVATIKLDVLYPPKIISVLHNNTNVTGKTIVVRENEDVHLEAVVEGNPVPYVAWISPKTILWNSTKRDFTITKIKRDKTGAYKCEISNGIPKGTSAEFKINVEFAQCKCNNGGTCNKDKTCKCPFHRGGKYCDGLSLAFIIIIVIAATVIVTIAVIVLCCWCKKRRKCPTSSVHDVVTEEETLREDTNGNEVPLAMKNMSYANEGPSAGDGSGFVQGNHGPAPGAAEGNYAEGGKAGAAGGVPLVAHASVDQSKKKKKKKKKGEKLEEDDMQGTATYAQVDKSKKKKGAALPEENAYAAVDMSKKNKKRKEGELFYADLSEFSGQRGGLTSVQVSPPPTLGPVKVSPKYEGTEYADISQFSSNKKEDKPVVGEEGKPEQQKPAADAAGPDGL